MTQLSSQWGLNIITGSARNQVGATARLVQSYIRSPEYFGTSAKSPLSVGAKAASESVPTGLRMRLNQKLVDDGVRSDPDDMATLLQDYLETIDFNALLPNPLLVSPDGNRDGQVDSHTCDCFYPIPDIVVHSTGYRVTRGPLSSGPWVVNYLRLSSNGLAMDLSLAHIAMDVTVTGYLDPSCAVACVSRNLTTASGSGTVGADLLHITVTVNASADGAGHPQVDVCPSCAMISTSNPYVDVDFGALEFLDGPLGLSNIATAILNAFRDDLESLVETELRNRIPGFVSDLLAGLKPQATIDLPPPVNTSLSLSSGFDRIQFAGNYPNGSLTADLSVSVTPANPVVENGYGSIRRDGPPPALGSTDYALGVGLKDDLLNQFLWAAWSGGALELDQLSGTECTAGDGSLVSLSAKLPPVIMPGTNGHQIDIGLGDLYLVATPQMQVAASQGVPASSDVALYASAILGASMSFDTASGELVLTPAENPEVEVQIVSAPEDADLDALSAQYGDLLRCALPKLLSGIVGAVPVFSLPIGGLNAPSVPSDAKWAFGDDAVLARPDSSFTITGSVAVK
jgi:hypothetical protein